MHPFLGQIKPKLTSPEEMETMLAQSCGGAFTEAIIKALLSLSQFEGSVVEAANVTGKELFAPLYNAIHDSLINRTPEEGVAVGEMSFPENDQWQKFLGRKGPFSLVG